MTDALSSATLADRHAELTHAAILEAAVAILEGEGAAEVTMRAVARRAGIGERTVFRYFATRDVLLDALAQEVGARLQLPPDPVDVPSLLACPAALYTSFDARATLVRAALHSELFDRMRRTQAARRWSAVQVVVDRAAQGRPKRDRTLAAANIRFHLSATAWHYYRAYFGFSLADSIASARLVVVQALAELGIDAGSGTPAPARPRRTPVLPRR